MYFEVRSRNEAGAVRVTVVGEVDLATIAEFRRELRAAAAAGLPVVVDLSTVDFIDSLGLGVLIGARRRAAEQDADLVVVDAPPHVERLIRTSGLDALLAPAPRV